MNVPVKRHIIAIGGGNVFAEPLLNRYVLQQTLLKKPKICFIPTASGDSDAYIDLFYQAMARQSCVPSHLSLFRGTTADLESVILNQNAIYVGGGNTRNLMTLWKDWGLDLILRKAYDQGIVMSGVSAGSLCWFDEGVTDSIPGPLTAMKTMGWLKGSNCPHYDGEVQRRPSYHRLIQNHELGSGYAADDNVGLHFIDEQFSHAVSSHPEKHGFKVTIQNEKVTEEKIEPRYLGGDTVFIRRAALQDARGIHEAHMTSILEVCSNEHSPEEIEVWGKRPYDAEARIKSIQEDLVWVVEDHGVIQGYACVVRKEWNGVKRARLMALYLTPNVLGHGVGKDLLQLALRQIQLEGMSEISLLSTLNAHSFYLKHGFVDTGAEQLMPMGSGKVRAIPMMKVLK